MNLSSATAAKTGKVVLMQRFIVLLCFPFLLWGTSINTQITFSGDARVSLRSITHAFNLIGYKFELKSFAMHDGLGVLHGIAMGNKAFSAAVLGENFKEQGIRIERAHADSNGLSLVLDTQSAFWNSALLGSDEGAELKKVNTPQWFRVEQMQHIRIEPPYAGQWYPDIAVLDASMHVLSSFRSPIPEEEFQFELPQGAYYLKISNGQGMKVLKEGMWIESMSPGR